MSEVDYLRAKLREIAVAAKLQSSATPDEIIARLKLVFAELESMAKELKEQ